MGRTIADALREEGLKTGLKIGEIRGRRQILLSQLQVRFGEVPPETQDKIAATEDIKQLDAWLHQVLSAPTLAQMNIGAGKRLRPPRS